MFWLSSWISIAQYEERATSTDVPVLSLVADSKAKGYEAACVPLTTNAWEKRWKEMCTLNGEGEDTGAKAEEWRAGPVFKRGEVTMTKLDEAEGVLGVASEWIELDSPDDWLRHDFEIALQQELNYATYLNVTTVIVPPPQLQNRAHVASYARAINACLERTPYITLSIRMPIYYPNATIFQPSPLIGASISLPTVSLDAPMDGGLRIPTKSPDDEMGGMWEMWDLVRSLCAYNTRLTLTLDMTPPLPSNVSLLKKWSAEPVSHIYLPASTFIANNRGYPVLPKPTQSFLQNSLLHRPAVILSGVSAGIHVRGGEDAYAQYIRHLEKTSETVINADKKGTVENFAQGYQDFLQKPLQPLMDNLGSTTYETFEKDPVKYRNYEEAIFKALCDRPANDRIVICVAGAGRGPIVARCLSAIERSRRTSVILYALEKNPNAYVTLQDRVQLEWHSRVKLIFGDMREVEPPELMGQVDILVSELLGSFGDNEVSPECLDGAVRFLKPNGISIPSSYTAHLAPLSSSRLYNEVAASKDVLQGSETPYVVMFQAVNILSADGGGTSGKCGPQVQECWEFDCPRKDAVLGKRGMPPTNSHNARSANLKFHIPHAGILHGLAGYFEAVLYQNIGLSIHPHRKDDISKDMLSWFPLFFPFKDPLYLPSNTELHVSLWRLVDQKKVWYEWHAEAFLSSTVPPVGSFISRPPSPAGEPNSDGILFSSSSSLLLASPLADAPDPFVQRVPQYKPRSGLVKIGQTALHNPGGRSSWIGL